MSYSQEQIIEQTITTLNENPRTVMQLREHTFRLRDMSFIPYGMLFGILVDNMKEHRLYIKLIQLRIEENTELLKEILKDYEK